jgi:NAD(P)H-dependent flavin oxidoreductase YrpB (nitropropane dioxygenase family)
MNYSTQITSNVLGTMAVPIVQAPMAGGPSTPALAVAVDRAGGLGFLAAGYLSAKRLEQDISTIRAQIDRFGVNVFVAAGTPADPERVRAYAARLQPEAERAGVGLGQPRFDDDAFEDKIELLHRGPVAAVSFTFGLPPERAIEQLHAAGSEVWLTVTSPQEARQAADAGADALIVQGVEAGGHRGVFVDDDSQSELTLPPYSSRARARRKSVPPTCWPLRPVPRRRSAPRRRPTRPPCSRERSAAGWGAGSATGYTTNTEKPRRAPTRRSITQPRRCAHTVARPAIQI